MLSLWEDMYNTATEASSREADPEMIDDMYWLKNGGPKKFGTPGSAARRQFYTVRHWLANIERMNCHDRRDRVFAYYGCFSPECRAQIVIDYSKSADEIFWLATLAMLEATRDLSIIAWGDEAHSDSNHTPTWAAKFSTPRERLPPMFDIKALQHSNPLFHILPGKDRRILQVKGTYLGSVNKVGPIYDRSQWSETPRFLKYVSDCWKLLEIDPQEPPSTQFLLTIMRGYRTRSFPKDQDDAMFQLLKETAHAHNGLSEQQIKLAAFRSLAKHILMAVHVERPMFSFSKTSDQEGSKVDTMYFGLGPPGIAAGDKICAIHGCANLLVLRQVGECHHIVGHAGVCEELIPDLQRYGKEWIELEEYLLQ
jgi:hypothetical protein